MRLLSITCLLISTQLCMMAQTDQEAILNTTTEYFDLLGEKKISEALDYVHPDLIGMLGKETYETQYKQLFNNPTMQVSMSDFSQDSVSQIHEHEGVKYALVDYSFMMQFVVDVSDDKDGTFANLLLASYKGQFGEENVTSETAGTYDIKVIREMFAVSSPKFEGWRILDFEEGMKIFLVSIIPEAVFEHFNR